MNPTRNNVLVERIPGVKTTTSGILLKTSFDPDRGKVKSIGPEVSEVSLNEEVFLDWNKATKVENDLYIVSVEDIVFVFED